MKHSHSVWPSKIGTSAVLAVFAACSIQPTVGFAQESDVDSEAPLTILITASRFAETVDETLAPVSVIDREVIEQRQVTTVSEALQAVPGITLSRSGAVGNQTSLFLRGTESNHVLVLIDGVKVGSLTTGQTQFEHLPLEQIEKIEVVRGPRSSLYGSEAIGGVVQIFTRRGGSGGGETQPRLELGVGGDNTRKVNVGVSGGGSGGGWYNLGASAFSTDGYDTCLASFCVAERDDDGYENTAISVRGGGAASESLSLEGAFLQSDSDTEFDGWFNESEHRARTGSFKATWDARGDSKWGWSLLFGRSEDELESFGGGGARSSFLSTTREQIDWQGNFELSESSQLIAGVDCASDEVVSRPSMLVEDERDNTGAFALLRTEFGGNDMELALRDDDNATTGSVAWGRQVGADGRVTASFGTAFKEPTFNELYAPSSSFGTTTYRSNPDLEPETSRSIDVGYSHSSSGGRGQWGVNVYQTKIRDLIANRQFGNINLPVNIDEARIVGVEWSGSVSVDQWDVAAALTWQDAQDRSTARRGESLLRRPRRILDLDVSRRIGAHRVGANVYAKSESEDFGGVDLPGFARVGVRGEMRVAADWTLGLKIDNLFDKEYETVAGYPQDGLNFMATLRYAPRGR